MHDSFSVPGVESQRATDLLTASFPTQAGGSAQVVFHATDGTLSDPANAAAMASALDAIDGLDHVVVPPPSATLRTSADDTIALATVRYDADTHSLPGWHLQPAEGRGRARGRRRPAGRVRRRDPVGRRAHDLRRAPRASGCSSRW